MVSENEYIRHEGLEIAFYVLLGVFMAIILPLFVGFGLRGFEESFIRGKPIEFGSVLGNYLIYYILIVAALFAVVFPIVGLLIIRKGNHPAVQEKPDFWRIFSVSFIHDPEKGALYTMFRHFGMSQKKNFMKWSLSIFRMLVIGTIIFGTLGIISLVVPTAQFVGIPNKVLQQITPVTQVIFTAEPPAFSETGTMLLVLMLLSGINAYLCAKNKWGINTFYAIEFVLICPLIGFLWLGFHNIVYANSAQARFATFIFGWVGSTMTVAFGSFIFWYVWHFWNNVFAKLSEIMPGNADVIFYSVLAMFILIVAYISIEYYFYSRRKKKKSEVQEPTF